MTYSVQMSTSRGGCGCGGSSMATSSVQTAQPAAVVDSSTAVGFQTVTPGVIRIPSGIQDLHLVQGVSQSITMCLYEGALGDLSCIRTDGTITLVDATCIQVGDTITILGEAATRGGPCFNRPIFAPVLTVATDLESFTIDPTNLPVALNEDACYPETAGSITVPIGCTVPESDPQTDPPIVLKINPAENVILSGGIISRTCDYREEIGVNTTANDNWAWTKILGKIQSGDYIKIEDAGVTKYVKVLESHNVQTSAGLINKFRLESAPTSTGCYVGIIRRGLFIPIYSRIDANGCFEISIDGASTAGIQLPGQRVYHDNSGVQAAPLGQMMGNQTNVMSSDYRVNVMTSSGGAMNGGSTGIYDNTSRMNASTKSRRSFELENAPYRASLSDDCNPCEICLGTYSVTLSWFYTHPTTNKLVSRSQVVARGRAFMEPSHHLSFQE